MELFTPNLSSLKYVYFKTPSVDRINFKVKTKASAHICLSTEANLNQPFIEFFIENNVGLSELRLRNSKTYTVNNNVVRKNLLSESEYRGFWINFNKGKYELGFEGECVPFLQWQHPNPFKINYIGVFSFKHEGFWKINLDNLNLPNWVPASNGFAPSGAVETGESLKGPHFIARVKHDISKSFIPARLLPNYKCLYGFMGVEFEAKEYEVLCGGSGYWVKVTNGNFPENAFACTDAIMKKKFFIGRATIENWLLCGKVYPNDGMCLIAYNRKEHFFGNYEIYVC